MSRPVIAITVTLLAVAACGDTGGPKVIRATYIDGDFPPVDQMAQCKTWGYRYNHQITADLKPDLAANLRGIVQIFVSPRAKAPIDFSEMIIKFGTNVEVKRVSWNLERPVRPGELVGWLQADPDRLGDGRNLMEMDIQASINSSDRIRVTLIHPTQGVARFRFFASKGFFSIPYPPPELRCARNDGFDPEVIDKPYEPIGGSESPTPYRPPTDVGPRRPYSEPKLMPYPFSDLLDAGAPDGP